MPTSCCYQILKACGTGAKLSECRSGHIRDHVGTNGAAPVTDESSLLAVIRQRVPAKRVRASGAPARAADRDRLARAAGPTGHRVSVELYKTITADWPAGVAVSGAAGQQPSREAGRVTLSGKGAVPGKGWVSGRGAVSGGARCPGRVRCPGGVRCPGRAGWLGGVRWLGGAGCDAARWARG